MHSFYVAERPAYHNILLRPSNGPLLAQSKVHCLIDPLHPSEILTMQLFCSFLLVRHMFSRPILSCSFDVSCTSYLRPKKLSMGPRRGRGLVQGVPDSLMPLLAHHSHFEAGMFLVGSHLLQRPDRGTLLAYAWARPKFHPTGLVSRH